MRKINQDLFFILLLSLICTALLSNLFTNGVYSSHDSQVHIARITQFTEAISDGHFPVRWLNHWYFGYGYPTYVYLYSLPYYIGSLFNLFITDPEVIFKALIFISLFFSSITFYIFAKNLKFKDISISKSAAAVGAIFYVSAPYRFADIYERGALGEALFFIFAPLLFLAVAVFTKHKIKGFILSSVSTFALITTHLLSFLIFLPMVIIYSLIYLKKKFEILPKFLLAVILGFTLAAYQWVPMAFEQKYIELDKTYFNIYEGNFISIYQLLRIPKEGINTGTGIQLGSAQILIISFTIIYILIQAIREKRLNLIVIFFLATIIISAYLTTDFSKAIWANFKPIQTLIFSWRFLTYTTFATALLASVMISKITASKLKIAVITIFILVAIFPSRHYLKGKNWHTFDEQFYASYTDPLKLDSYYLPKGTNKNLENINLPRVSIIKGKGETISTIIKSDEIRTNVRLSANSLVQFHTIYFPGWQLYVDDQKSLILKDYANLEGLIVANLKPGYHKLDLRFEETFLRKTANYTTVFSFLFLFSIITFKKLRRVA